ncbi:MAG: DUF72 domain-containing protein, partial [Bryobacteraceae bacterium]
EQITCKVFPEHPRYGAQGGRENPSCLDAGLLRESFLQPLQPYADRIGPLIFEFGAFPRGALAGLDEFLAALDPFLASLPPGMRYAVEVRNPEFLRYDYFDCLRARGVAHVFNAWARMPELGRQLAMPGSATADFSVCRALLRRGRPYEEAVRAFSSYTEVRDENPEVRESLRELIRRGREARRQAYIYVNNRLEGNAPATILAVTR